jgi:TRAP transporter TAXI family solute receptor
MKNMRWYFLVAIIGLMVTFPLSSANASSADWPKAISIAAARVGTVNYTLSAGMAELITKEMHIKAVPEPSSVGGKTLHLLNDKKVEFAVSACDQAYDATRGIGLYKKYGKMNARLMWMGSETPFAMVSHGDLGLRSVSELRGKRIMGIYPGNMSFTLVMDLFLKAEGMTRKDVTDISFTGWRQGATAVQEKRVAAFIHPFPSEGMAGWIKQISMDFPVRMFGISEEKVDSLAKEYSFLKKTKLKAKYYGDILYNQDLVTVGNIVSWFCRSDLPDDFVYAVMKTTFDNLDKLYPLHKFVRDYTDNPLAPFDVPMHPGVIKYWKEKGRWTQALQQRQDRLLKELGVSR